VKFDPAAGPFVLIAAVPAAVSAFLGPPWLSIALLVLPLAILLFFRDPDRTAPQDPTLILSPADGRVMYAGDGKPDEAPPGSWRQVTIFLSLFDVHINRTPAAGRVTRVEYLPGSFRAAFKPDAHANERSEIWIDHHGVPIVVRQVVGVLARRVVCRVKPGDVVAPGARIGLMKFGSRMDVFVPATATLTVTAGQAVVAGETVVARLAPGSIREGESRIVERTPVEIMPG
jgi:phosphatidylserine decarboxylase